MAEVIPIHKHKENFNEVIKNLSNLCKEDLNSINTLILEKLDSSVPLIQEIGKYLILSGGKRLRPLLTTSCFHILNNQSLKNVNHIGLAAAVEFIHAATLLHDDVIDESDLRRGFKTTNALWGNQSSILVGDYLLSRCFEIMVDDGDLEILKLLSSTSAKIAQGEVMQLEHKGEADLLEETYIDIINLKTAALFSAATKTGACLAGSNDKEKSALESYGKNLGLAFQIADDALDYYSKELIFGKKIGKDFYEGKVTLPLIIVFVLVTVELTFFIALLICLELYPNPANAVATLCICLEALSCALKINFT